MVESKGNQTPQGAPKSPEADLSQKTLTSAEEGKKGDGGSAKIGEPKSLLDKLTEFLPAIAFPAILLGSWIAAVIAPLTAGQQLSIIAAQIPSGDHLELRGRGTERRRRRRQGAGLGDLGRCARESRLATSDTDR